MGRTRAPCRRSIPRLAAASTSLRRSWSRSSPSCSASTPRTSSASSSRAASSRASTRSSTATRRRLVTNELGYEVAEPSPTESTIEASGEAPTRRGCQGRHHRRGRRPGQPGVASAHRDRHGSRRPRQDQPARRDPQERGRGRRARRHHPAHRRQRGRAQRPPHRVPRHARSRGVHRHARPRRTGHGYRGPGGRGG